MKPKLLLCLALVLSGGFATQCTYGYEVEYQINHTNLTNDFSFLQISAARIHYTNNETVFFTVIVTPKVKQQSEHFEGHLGISDSHGFIAATLVEAKARSKSIAFQFLVSAKYLETSEFKIEEIAGEFASPTDYCFNLKEFADEK
jgi:hypothetical protein